MVFVVRANWDSQGRIGWVCKADINKTCCATTITCDTTSRVDHVGNTRRGNCQRSVDQQSSGQWIVNDTTKHIEVTVNGIDTS